MAKEAKNENLPETLGGPGAEGNVDQIRDILFGGQMRDYEKRFQRMEERILNESADLKDNMKKRMDSLESYVKDEVKAIGERIKEEQSERTSSDKEIQKELGQFSREMEKKTGKMEEKSEKGFGTMREKLLDQSKALTEELEEKYKALSERLASEAEDLRDEKTGREDLAAILTEAAMRLTGQFKLPEGE